MKKVLIIEDELIAANKLEAQLKAGFHEFQVCAKLESIKDAVQWLRKESCDLLFVDIHLSDGVSFEIFRQVEVRTPVIFTTAYDQYAIKAFEVNSIDYLLKPVSDNALKRALEKFESFSTVPDYESLYQAVLDMKKEYRKRFTVVSGQSMRIIPVEDVAFFMADGKYAFLIDTTGQQHLINHTLDKLTDEIDPAKFFRVNRQYIVSVDAVSRIIPHSKGRVSLVLNPPAPGEVLVSVERSPEFKRWMDQ